MNREHYNLIIQKTECFKGIIDGDDIGEIYYLIDDLTFEFEIDYKNLLEELFLIMNALHCEHGMDYGKTKNWDKEILEIIERFKEGYKQNEENLDILLNIIKNK